MRWIVVVLASLAALGFLIYVRVAPSDRLRWHVDPMAVPLPRGNGWLLRDGVGNAAAPVFAASPAAVLDALDSVAMSTPRTTRLTGSAEEGRITWITRTRLMGFPDYTTATAIAGPEGTRFVVLARQRFGSRDHGVNRARVEGWLGRLAAPAP
jgi:uncharacterized protein (DUF1499 family)